MMRALLIGIVRISVPILLSPLAALIAAVAICLSLGGDDRLERWDTEQMHWWLLGSGLGE